MRIKQGTCYFPSIQLAIAYYAAYEENPKAAVARKLREGSIFIGKPEVKPGQILTVEDRRYHITEETK